MKVGTVGLVLLFILALGTATSGGENKAPSLRETTDWIARTVENNHLVDPDLKYESTSVSFDGCSGVIERRTSINLKKYVESIQRFNLIDYQHAEYLDRGDKSYYLTFKFNRRSAVTEEWSDGDVFKRDSLSVWLKDESIGKRLQKAFYHASKLCGSTAGQKEPF